jgi:hypothetical protein
MEQKQNRLQTQNEALTSSVLNPTQAIQFGADPENKKESSQLLHQIQEPNKKPTLLIKTEGSIKSQIESILQRTGALKEHLKSSASPISILAILKEIPCPLKCVHEIKEYHYENDIDSLYSGRHDWVRKRIIEGIIDRFEDLILVRSEHGIINGKLDVAVFPDKIRLKFGRRLIAIVVYSTKLNVTY